MRFFSPVLYLLAACVVASCEGQVRSENPVDAATKDASHDAADGGDGGGVSVDASSLGSCAQPGECVLVTRTCCGVCGAPAVTDMDAVRWDETETHHNELCGTGPVNCPRCAIMTNPHLGAICRASHCAAVDVRTDATSSCTTDADCMLRFGLSCCEMCAGTDAELTAIRQDALHDLTTCAPNQGACPPCVPTYPTRAHARCNAQTRQCEVARTP
jgi:hypothetical protein